MSEQRKLVFGAIAATAVVATLVHYLVTRKYWSKEDQEEEPTARIFASKEDLSTELCAFVADSAKKAIVERGVFHLAVAGGSLLDLLSMLADHKDSVDFAKVVVSFANHKCVAPDSDKATLKKCKSKFADAAGITTFVAPSPTPSSESDGSAEAEFYAKALISAGISHSGGFPMFDMVLLGLGSDGHVASCHPMGSAVADQTKAVAGSPKSGEPSSITLTIASLNKARQTVVVVCGGSKGKKEAVKRAMTRPAEEPRGTFPAQLLRQPLFFLDAEAAADL